MTARKHEKPLVAVIGAGVVGLTTALLLQCNHYGKATLASFLFSWSEVAVGPFLFAKIVSTLHQLTQLSLKSRSCSYSRCNDYR
jgi:hypothetical protein